MVDGMSCCVGFCILYPVSETVNEVIVSYQVENPVISNLQSHCVHLGCGMGVEKRHAGASCWRGNVLWRRVVDL